MNKTQIIFYKKCKKLNKLDFKNFNLSMHEYILDDNYYNNYINYPSFNLTYLENEFINLKKKNNMNDIRLIRDTTTNVFTKICIEDNKSINDYDFINFLFQYTYTNLLQNINTLLASNKHYAYPLLPNEFLYLYFKGGTLMKYFKNFVYETLNINENVNVDIDFIKNFKLSDTDMSLSIKCNSYMRYEQLKHYCISSFSKSLDELGTIINHLKEYKTNNKPLNIINITDSINNNKKFNNTDIIFSEETFYNNIDEFKIILQTLKLEIIKHKIDKITTKYIIKVINNIVNNIVNSTEKNYTIETIMNIISCNPTENSLIIELLDFILLYKDINVVSKCKKVINKYKSKLIIANKYLNFKLLNKIIGLFDNYEEFKTKLAHTIKSNIIDNKDINEVYDFDVEPPIKYIINKDKAYTKNISKALDFDSCKRSDFILAHNKNVKSNRILIEFNNKKQNYTSYNNIINTQKNNKFVTFSLIRLKHLVTIKDFLISEDIRANENLVNTIPQTQRRTTRGTQRRTTRGTQRRTTRATQRRTTRTTQKRTTRGTLTSIQPKTKPLLFIPTELLDISIIPPYNGIDNYIYKNSYNKYKYCIPITKENKTISYIVSFNIENILYDLSYVLFGTNSFIPFHDTKYSKRIFRLLFFIKLNSKLENDSIIYQMNYDIINKLIHTINIINNNINISSEFNNILSELLLNKKINIEEFDISKPIYEILQFNNYFKPLKELYSFIILFTYLILNNNKNLLFNICKINFEYYQIIDDFILSNNVDSFYYNFKNEFIKFINTIKDKLVKINNHAISN